MRVKFKIDMTKKETCNQVIAGSFSVDITDVGPSSVKTGEAVPINQGSTLVTPVAFRPSIGSTERVSGAGIGDDQRGTGGSDYFMQPNLINMNFMAHQWRGKFSGAVCFLLF